MKKRITMALLAVVLLVAVSGCRDIYMSEASHQTLQKTVVLAEKKAEQVDGHELTLAEAEKYIQQNAVAWRLFLDFAEGKKASK